MTDEERKTLGEEMHRQVSGDLVATAGQGSLWAQARDQLYAEIWSRDVLTIRDRRLLILGVVVALGEQMPFEVHARSALMKGELSDGQLREVLLILAAYCGYPRVTRLAAVVEKIIEEQSGSHPTT